MGTPLLAPRITQPYSEPPVSLLGYGAAPFTSTLAVHSNAPSAPSITCIGASHTPGVGSSTSGVSRGATTGHGKPGGTMARSAMLAANNATSGKYEDVTGHAAGRRKIGDEEV
jgi:hypothetical protein